jgi:hypothetical protein
MNLRQLERALATAGQPTRVVAFPDGTQLLLLACGGRLLGLFPKGTWENFFWTHNGLGSPESARALFSARWPNPGGERTWLAPVPELFVADMSRLWETYREPPALDPGAYACVGQGEKVRLVNHAHLRLFRAGTAPKVVIERSFLPAPDPLRHERGFKAKYQYAGCTVVASLRFRSDPALAGAPIGLWQLLQLPPGGEMLLPTYGQPRPRRLFGEIPPKDLQSDLSVLRYFMRSRTTAKIAVRAVQTTGRVGYVHACGGGRFALIIRNLFVNPSGEYVDPPFDDLGDLGYSFQACNVAEPALGFFSEIEHHVPAIGPGTGASSRTDISQVWAFRGSKVVVNTISRFLLGCTPSE